MEPLALPAIKPEVEEAEAEKIAKQNNEVAKTLHKALKRWRAQAAQGAAGAVELVQLAGTLVEALQRAAAAGLICLPGLIAMVLKELKKLSAANQDAAATLLRGLVDNVAKTETASKTAAAGTLMLKIAVLVAACKWEEEREQLAGTATNRMFYRQLLAAELERDNGVALRMLSGALEGAGHLVEPVDKKLRSKAVTFVAALMRMANKGVGGEAAADFLVKNVKSLLSALLKYYTHCVRSRLDDLVKLGVLQGAASLSSAALADLALFLDLAGQLKDLGAAMRADELMAPAGARGRLHEGKLEELWTLTLLCPAPLLDCLMDRDCYKRLLCGKAAAVLTPAVAECLITQRLDAVEASLADFVALHSAEAAAAAARYTAHFAAYDAMLAEIQGQLEELQGRVHDLEGRTDGLEGQVEELQGQLTVLKAQVEHMTRMLTPGAHQGGAPPAARRGSPAVLGSHNGGSPSPARGSPAPAQHAAPSTLCKTLFKNSLFEQEAGQLAGPAATGPRLFAFAAMPSPDQLKQDAAAAAQEDADAAASSDCDMADASD